MTKYQYPIGWLIKLKSGFDKFSFADPKSAEDTSHYLRETGVRWTANPEHAMRFAKKSYAEKYPKSDSAICSSCNVEGVTCEAVKYNFKTREEY